MEEEEDDNFDPDDPVYDRRPECGCPYCYCCCPVEIDGESCSDCRYGCHQG
jgi:hypothetical protein